MGLVARARWYVAPRWRRSVGWLGSIPLALRRACGRPRGIELPACPSGVLVMFLWHGSRERLRPWPTARDPGFPAGGADRLRTGSRLPWCRVRRRTVLCHHGAGCLLSAWHDGEGGAAPDAVRARLWRPSTGSLAGNRPGAQPACQAAPCSAARIGGERVSGTPDRPERLPSMDRPANTRWSVAAYLMRQRGQRFCAEMHGTRDHRAKCGCCTAGREEPRGPSRLSHRGCGMH
jgi:hypothetical protein